MMKHVDFTVNIFHDNFDCWYVFMKWCDVYKDIKIIYVMPDYCIGKRKYSYHGVDHMSLHCKEYHTRYLHLL